MNPAPSYRMAAISALLTLPALLLCGGGVLSTAFGLTAANLLIESILATSPGKLFLSPVAVLGGVLTCLALNVWALCRVRVGLDTGAVYVTFYIARAVPHLLVGAFAMLLASLLVLYALVENSHIVPR